MKIIEFFREDKTLDTQKIILDIWENRTNSVYVDKCVQILTRFLDEKAVFEEVEFYLPQLAHMIIHIKFESLEYLTLSISRTSLHTAFLLTYIVMAALEDYQPEDALGYCVTRTINTMLFFYHIILPSLLQIIRNRNPKADQIVFNRCAILLYIIESGAVFGHDQTDLSEFIRVLERTSTKVQFGELYYKRVTRRHWYNTKGWIKRYFEIDQRVLFCYKDSSKAVLKRGKKTENI